MLSCVKGVLVLVEDIVVRLLLIVLFGFVMEFVVIVLWDIFVLKFVFVIFGVKMWFFEFNWDVLCINF